MSRYSFDQDFTHENLADCLPSISFSQDFSHIKFRGQGFERAPEKLSQQDIGQIFNEILARKMLVVFPPYDPRARKKEDLLDPKRDAHVFDFASTLIEQGGKATAVFFEVLCFFDSCAIARRLMNTHSGNIQLIFERFLKDRGYKQHSFFCFDRGMIWEWDRVRKRKLDPREICDAEARFCFDSELDTNTDTASPAITESSSNEAVDGFIESSPLMLPGYPEKEKEELAPRVSQKQRQDLKPEALQETQKEIIRPNSLPKTSYTPALFQEESKTDDLEKIKKIIISALESFTLDQEDELIIYGLEESLKKSTLKFEALSDEGKNTAQGIKLAKWISVLQKKKTLVPCDDTGLKFRDPSRGFRAGEVDRRVIRDLREKTAGALNGIKGAKTISEVRGVLSLLYGNLCTVNQDKNQRSLIYSQSPVLTLVENFLVSDFKGISPLEKRVSIAEKRKAPEVSSVARPNDLPIIFAVLTAVLQFLSELVASFCDSKSSPVPVCFLSA